MSRLQLYKFLLIVCGVGVIYLLTGASFTCFFKSLTGIPCPACGTTRFIQGDYTQGNPVGIVVGAAFLLPLGVIFDLISKGDRVFRAYLWVENKCRQPWIAILLITLVLVNWVWTIYKGL